MIPGHPIQWSETFPSQLWPAGRGSGLLHPAAHRPNLPLWRSPLFSWGRHHFKFDFAALVSNSQVDTGFAFPKSGHQALWKTIVKVINPSSLSQSRSSGRSSRFLFPILKLSATCRSGRNSMLCRILNSTVTGWKSWRKTGFKGCPSEQTHRGYPPVLRSS